jgi:hypothetical protein
MVDAPIGARPFRVHVDPSQDGADVGFAVLDRLMAGCCTKPDSHNCATLQRERPRLQVPRASTSPKGAILYAWQLEQFGLNNLRLVERSTPAPGPGEILVEVSAISLNYRDTAIVDGVYSPDKMP